MFPPWNNNNNDNNNPHQNKVNSVGVWRKQRGTAPFSLYICLYIFYIPFSCVLNYISNVLNLTSKLFFVFRTFINFLHRLSFYSLSYCHQTVAAGVDVEVAEGLPPLLHQLVQFSILVGDENGIGHHQAEGQHGQHVN